MLNLLSRARRQNAERQTSFVAVGYPKVGNTWLRLMLGRYVQLLGGLQETPLFEPVDAETLASAAGPQAVGYFTHAPLTWESQTASDLTVRNVIRPFAKQKVIILVRHPLDALASFHKQRLYRSRSHSFHGDLVQFVEHPVFGLNKFMRFYALWGRHLGENRVLLWRYEDAHANAAVELERVVRFLDLPQDQTLVDQAVRFGSFDNMRAMERSEQQPRYRSSGFEIFATGDRSNPDAFHVRKGRVGGFRDEFSADAIERFQSIINRDLPIFYGYSTG